MHTPRAHLDALLAEGRLIHAIRDLRLLTGMGLAEARDGLVSARDGAWPPALLAALPSWGDTAAQRALRDELWPALAALGPPRALVFAEKDFRDGLLVLIDESLHFARRGLRGPELEALGSLPALDSLELSATLSGIELIVRGGAREHRLRRIPERDRPLLERLQARVGASGEGGDSPAPAPRREPPEPTPSPRSATRGPATTGSTTGRAGDAPKARAALDREPELVKEARLPEAPKRLEPAAEPAQSPLADSKGLHTQLLRLAALCALVAALTQAIWTYAPWHEPNSKVLLSWLLTVGVGLNLAHDPKRTRWAVAGAFAAALLQHVVFTLEAWSFMVMTWPLLGAFWLRSQGREHWIVEAGFLGLAVVVAMSAVDLLGMQLSLPSFLYRFSDLFVFWGLHLFWERRQLVREAGHAA